MSTRTWSNWAGIQTARPQRLVTPRSAHEVVGEVARAAAEGLTIKAVGSGHSFTGVALTDGVLLRSEGLAALRSVDPERGLATVEAGMRLDRLNEQLARHGLALTNLGDIAKQTTAGAIATGTHGTGRDNGGLAAQVEALELVLADGSVVTCSAEEKPDLFHAARVNLGALGIVTAVTFRVESAFLLHAREVPMPLEPVLEAFDDQASANEHFEFYWFPHTERTLVKRNNRTEGPAIPLSRTRRWWDDHFLNNTTFGMLCRAGRAVPRLIPPLNRFATRALSARAYIDASYRVFGSPRRVRFIEMEYAIPRAAAVEAFQELKALIERSDWRISFPVEVRVAPKDRVWLSTAYGRDTAYIAVHMYRRTPYEDYFSTVEKLLMSYDGRPHWGKLHSRDAAYLASVYPRFRDFLAVRDQVDPKRRFTNPYLRQVLGD